jgi:hypothetical protein
MREAWKEILVSVLAIIIAIFLLYDRVFAYFIKRRTAQLELEKKIVTELVIKAEEEYFEKGRASLP